MKRFAFVLFLLMALDSGAQALNDYQYIIVPVKFEFQKSMNQYRLNSIAKMNFEKIGFKVFYDNEVLPADVAENSCNRLRAEVTESKNMFTTKIVIHLFDCANREIFKSEEGTSRDKDIEKSYVEALQSAFTSIANQNYKFTGKSASKPKVEVAQSSSSSNISSSTTSAKSVMALNAKPIENGYDLYLKDNEGNMYLFTIYKTSSADVFIAFQKSKQGVLIKKDGQWFFESYESGKLLSEAVSITGMN